MVLTAIGEAGDIKVTLTAEINTAEMTDDAVGRIHGKMRMEATRFAQISFVDGQDRVAAVAERKRLRTVPADRPHIIVGAGTTDPATAVVVNGEYEVGGSRGTSKKLMKAVK